MMVNPTSLTVGDRALIKEPFISKNSDNPAYYDTIFIPRYLTFRPVVIFYKFDFEIVYLIMLL
jgi:hypothetical protein